MNFGADFAAVAFGLLSAATWGAGDFSGGLATKRTNVMGVTVFAHATGLVFFLLVAILTNEPSPTTSDIAWALIAGCSGVFGLIAFYRGLAIGRMGVVAPVSAVITAGVPVIVGIFTQGAPAN